MTIPNSAASVTENFLDTATVSLFKDSFTPDPIAQHSLTEWLLGTRNGQWKAQVLAVRKLYGKAKPYKAAKEKLPCFTPCGTFRYRDSVNLLLHNETVHGDVDKLPPEQATAYVDQLRHDPHVVYVFLSPSAHGVKYGVRIDHAVTTNDAYKHAWEVVAAAHLALYGLAWDQSAKDISRLCYVSYDTACYIATDDPLAFPIPPPRPKKRRTTPQYARTPDSDRVRSALDALPNHDEPYEVWRDIGMALHSTGEAWARGLWDDWSSRSEKYAEREQEKAWTHFKADGGITLGTLFDLAKKNGWQDPRGARTQEARHNTARTVPDMTQGQTEQDVSDMQEAFNNEERPPESTPHGNAVRDKDPWPPRQPLPPLLPAVPTLPETMIPAGLRGWIVDAAERMQVPLEYLAIPALVALASVIGRKMGIYPKQQDDWLVIPNLWGAIVGRPGLLKTPALNQALKPLDLLANNAFDAFEKAEAKAKVQRAVLTAKIAGLKDAIKKSARAGSDSSGEEKHLEVLQLELDVLINYVRRFKANDVTVAKLVEILKENPHGILFFRDELAGWLNGLSQAGREGDREFFLETWEGNGSYVMDRIGRGTTYVKGLCLSIVGGIQPGKLAQHVYDASEGAAGDDGLLQRFQLIVWPVPPTTYTNVDHWPIKQERDRAYKLYQGMEALDPADVGATTAQYASIPALRFAADAQALFDAWRTDLENRLRAGDREAPAFEAHLAKYRSLMPSLALIFHLLNKLEGWQGTAVTLEVTRQAAAWGEFLELHARKVYAGILNKDLQAAHAIKARIDEGTITSGQTVRALYRHQWSMLRTPDDVFGGLATLERSGWLRVTMCRSAEGGRPTEVIDLNPTIDAHD
jgi:putative DNA primase/helicase